MNQRIKELAKKCYETGPIGKDGWPEYSKFNEEKFAELIVRKCADIGQRYADGNYEVPNQILEYFGMEEE